jgi:anti-sigma-K factor RskA
MTADTHALTGAYVCDALPEAERVTFERHLSRCEACRQEVAELRDTTALLGAAAGAQPPPGFHDRVMAQVRSVRQVRPPAASLALARERRRRGLVRRISWAAAGTLVACGAALGVIAVRENQEIASMRQQHEAMSDFLASRDLRTSIGRVSTGGTVTIMSSRSHDAMMLAASGLTPLPSSETYQVWMKEAGGMHPGPVAHPSAGGVIGPMMARGIDGATAVTMTVEPAHGSAHPSGNPVLVIRLTT